MMNTKVGRLLGAAAIALTTVACAASEPGVATDPGITTAVKSKLAADDTVGEIRSGARADLCVVDDQGVLQRVMQRGRWVKKA